MEMKPLYNTLFRRNFSGSVISGRLYLPLLLLLFAFPLRAQKKITAVFTGKAPKIDGEIDAVWADAPPGGTFYMFDPGDNDPEPPGYHTTVRLLYDHSALYILAEMNDPAPDKIFREFALRDQFAKADFFSVILNPFKTPGNNYLFGISASGSQLDGIQTNGLNTNWNAEWFSAAKITEQGWIAEMAIPYSALRFQNSGEQRWGITFVRGITSRNEKYAWTKIDKTKEGDMVQFMGEISGLRDISPPVRLNFYPYAATGYDRYDGTDAFRYSFGLDFKYGINEHYTIDATLIPDFSDTSVDNKTLNLTPFEQYYDEKRPFFTEGMQLFRKGHIFYSRRIGGTPVGYADIPLEGHEIILENPSEIPLINSIKLSGRSQNGLGIGFLNAVTSATQAVIRDTLSGNERTVTTGPLANYNMLVVDYAFGKNNSVGIANTDVIRRGAFRDANVTALTYSLYTLNNTMEIRGSFGMSLIHDSGNWTDGYKSYFSVSKTSGSHRMGFDLYFVDDRFDSNDMGFMRRNNIVIYDFEYRYQILKPRGFVNTFYVGADLGLDHTYRPYGIYQKDFEIYANARTKSQWDFGLETGWVSEVIDYYEPRTDGFFYLRPARYYSEVYLSSDERKRLQASLRLSHSFTPDSGEIRYGITHSDKFTVNNRLRMNYSIRLSQHKHDKGYYGTEDNGQIQFGERNRFDMEQSAGVNYYFSSVSAFKISAIHNWSTLDYSRIFTLHDDGLLYGGVPVDTGKNYNFWNLDVGYTWDYSPGSRLIILYRNMIDTGTEQLPPDYFDNLSGMFSEPVAHQFLIKTIYNLDYARTVKKWF